MPKFSMKFLYPAGIRILKIILRASEEGLFLGAFFSMVSTGPIFQGTDNSLLLLTPDSKVLTSLWLFAQSQNTQLLPRRKLAPSADVEDVLRSCFSDCNKLGLNLNQKKSMQMSSWEVLGDACGEL